MKFSPIKFPASAMPPFIKIHWPLAVVPLTVVVVVVVVATAAALAIIFSLQKYKHDAGCDPGLSPCGKSAMSFWNSAGSKALLT